MTGEQEVYYATLRKRGFGWSADLGWIGLPDSFGLQGPIFWRPSRDAAIRRADRHVRRRLRRQRGVRHDEISFALTGNYAEWVYG